MRRLSHKLRESSRIDFPSIRIGLEPFRYEDEKKQHFIGLKDPLELSDLVILLPQDLYYLLQYFDGAHSIEDLTSLYMRKFNTFLLSERLTTLIKKMDDGLLLDNDRSQKRRANIAAAYRKKTIREPACAGVSYADEKHKLQHELENYRHQALSDVSFRQFTNRCINGMLVPHIDPRLGGAAYASAYKVLEVTKPVDLFVILGISHQVTEQPFVLTAKDFQTPLGLVHTEKKLLSILQETCSNDFFQDEIVHRDEHSIEFQTVFLKHFLKYDFNILPILCSFSHDMHTRDREQFNQFTTALRATLADYSGSICFLASVDFSHIGPYYGDAVSPDSFLLSKVEAFDRQVLDSVAHQQKKQLEQHFIQSNNKYHICGFPALRTLLELLPRSDASLLTYDNAIMDSRRSTVTFVSMIFS